MTPSTIHPVVAASAAQPFKPAMTQAQLMAKVLSEEKTEAPTERTPPLKGQAFQDDQGDVYIKLGTAQDILNHVTATKNGAIGFVLECGEFQVAIPRENGT